MNITIEKTVQSAAVAVSQRVLETAAMFGLGVDEDRVINIIPRTSISLPVGGIVFVTGPSGSGKSTILKLLRDQCMLQGIAVIEHDQRVGDAAWGGQGAALVDCVGKSLDESLALLSLVGLGDAFVMLRQPKDLSDGQRARFALARAFETAQQHDRCVILVDEFCATLDRITAMTLAAAVRKWVNRTKHTLVVATTHDDLLEPLQPDVLVYKDLGLGVEVACR